MKKKASIIFYIIVLLLVITAVAATVVGCGNHQLIDTKHTFDKAYIKIGDGDWKTVEVDKWSDYEGEQLQLVLKDGTVLVIHSLNCILYTGELPTRK